MQCWLEATLCSIIDNDYPINQSTNWKLTSAAYGHIYCIAKRLDFRANDKTTRTSLIKMICLASSSPIYVYKTYTHTHLLLNCIDLSESTYIVLLNGNVYTSILICQLYDEYLIRYSSATCYTIQWNVSRSELRLQTNQLFQEIHLQLRTG